VTLTRMEKRSSRCKTPLYAWDIGEILRAFRANNAITCHQIDHLQLAYEEYWYSPVRFGEVLDCMEMHGLTLFDPDDHEGAVWNVDKLPPTLKADSTVWLNTNFYIATESSFKFFIASLTTFDPDVRNSPIGDCEHFELGTWQKSTVTKSETKQVTPKRRYEVLVRDNHTCQSCGAKAPNTLLQVDHIFPRSLGGSNEMDNLQTLCIVCNIGKGATYKE
jgi:hypothetical protein